MAQAGGVGDSRTAAPARPFDDDWRRWVAENLLLGVTPEALLPVLIGNGFPGPESAREIETAARSPYLKGADRLRNRLRKRDWLLASYRKLRRLDPRSGEVERRHTLSRVDFLADHYSVNRPVVITGMMDDWPALRRWGLDDFDARFGDRQVEVQVGRDAAPGNYEAEREKFARTVRFGDFLATVRASGVTNDVYMTAANGSKNKEALAGLWDDVVQVPEYLDGRDPGAGFFWLGPAGTVTPFHHDLTNNFMAQVVGRKRVKIAPSWDMPLMANDFHVFSRVDGRVTPPAPRPAADAPQVLECVLHPGEILFLPVGCLHFVEALDVSATVSFTNFVFDNDFSSFYSTYHGV
ncbi:MAG: cupin-like domain-containing protein [Planctomycetia bacterium]|nr:cupin-like domain-containing protein [Planctomycetia bacterium]